MWKKFYEWHRVLQAGRKFWDSNNVRSYSTKNAQTEKFRSSHVMHKERKTFLLQNILRLLYALQLRLDADLERLQLQMQISQ